jgi:hypothetical protein
MDDFVKLSAEERRIFFEGTSGPKNMEAQIVEKDFWVCWTLKELFRLTEISPRAPFRIVNRPASDMAAHLRHPTHLIENLRTAQSDKAETTTEAQTRHISYESETGAGIGAKRSVHFTARLRLSMYCSPCSLCAPH